MIGIRTCDFVLDEPNLFGYSICHRWRMTPALAFERFCPNPSNAFFLRERLVTRMVGGGEFSWND